MGPLTAAFARFTAERSVSLCATSIASDYTQAAKWLSRCPVQDLERGRDAMVWVLRQQPPKAALRVGMYLKAFYRWATSEGVGLTPINPVASFRFPKRPQSDEEVIVIPRRELPLVMAALEQVGDIPPRWDLLARFMLQTGLRTGEAFAVRVTDIHGDVLRVHSNLTLTHSLKGSTKTNRKRTVPLNSVARECLSQLKPDPAGFLFPWSRSTFACFFRTRMERLHRQGVITTRFRPYDLRHTAISGWLEAGVPIAQVASWAGNSAQVIWQHYANATDDYEIPVL